MIEDKIRQDDFESLVKLASEQKGHYISDKSIDFIYTDISDKYSRPRIIDSIGALMRDFDEKRVSLQSIYKHLKSNKIDSVKNLTHVWTDSERNMIRRNFKENGPSPCMQEFMYFSKLLELCVGNNHTKEQLSIIEYCKNTYNVNETIKNDNELRMYVLQ